VEELATPLTTCGHYVLSRKSAIHEAWWNSDGLSLRCTGGLHPATCMSKCARQCTIHTHRLWSKLFFFQMFHMYVCYKYIYIYVYIYMYVCMYECMYVRMYVCTYVRMYVRTYVRMYVCMHACMHICMYVCSIWYMYTIYIETVYILYIYIYCIYIYV
jgi:hypothetical protein